MSRDEIVAGIKECAQQLGRTPYFEDFQQFKGIKEAPVLNAFGSWGRALRAAGMEPRGTYGKLSKGAILAAIQECAEALGRVPTHAEFKHETGITQYNVIGMFGSWSKALKACGMKPHQGSVVSIETHFKAWAELVRKNGQFPTTVEYSFAARHSARSLRHRVGRWSGVPQGFAEYAVKHGLEHEWADVLEIIKQKTGTSAETGPETSSRTTSETSSETSAETSTWSAPPASTGSGVVRGRMFPNRRVYGAALTPMPLAYAPVNEMGVVLLFGALARQLGFLVTWIGGAFPDCEAMREVAPGKFQPVLAEFEYESRNFLRHLHNVAECDLIVCWIHNWPDCPLEVIELSKIECVRQLLAGR